MYPWLHYEYTYAGMTLTQIYTHYVESCDELRQEKDENARLNNYLTQIMQELDEKTPALQKLRRDHDVVLQRSAISHVILLFLDIKK